MFAWSPITISILPFACFRHRLSTSTPVAWFTAELGANSFTVADGECVVVIANYAAGTGATGYDAADGDDGSYQAETPSTFCSSASTWAQDTGYADGVKAYVD